ncbi:aldehyde dehydrogenase (NADP(+)) [Georgenia sp. TF02-10]|uniref:aldehyde dehydrogenase (NADP(+)) n=1 Tax=Georgenia sp. TF02-10 TaxID=2917725 RepID=UPI001FA6D479|nr:aldehyde dehydrogenase (NADP(+)) [Georgenia sp. TF02-10]UNX55098.1 aldehyde dehydrogenase (NADP(+)) [Georgenia sp. TF02-10]
MTTTTETTETSPADVDRLVTAAAQATPAWGRLAPADRAAALGAVADALDAAAEELVPLAAGETHLPTARLTGELVRTTFQLRLFAEVLTEGSYLDARIDHADPDWGMGPRPDLRRVNQPLGPVVVFAASNFPFAFSVAGGDTASALAAGCPVILKAHPGHPRLSARTGEVVTVALQAAGAPAGTFAVIFGQDAGTAALQHPAVKAGSFTGSIRGGRALFDLAAARPEPIPFYGELSSVNPTFVTPAAAAARPEEIVTGFVGSVTMGVGQFCTKPGLLFVPRDAGLADRLAAAALPPAAPMLSDHLHAGYVEALDRLRGHDGVRVLAAGEDPTGSPTSPTVLATTAARFRGDVEELAAERFGPSALVVEYDDAAELPGLAALLEGQLTATVHGEDGDDVTALLEVLVARAGRVLWNGWPTGVSVTYAQQHGGPYPATTAPTTTSVGTAAIARFLRPVAFQDVPARFLPAALAEDNPLGIPRRVDGKLQVR